MFDIGMQELFLVCLVALVVLGPEQIPSAARRLGRVFARARKALRDLRYMIRRALEEEGADE